MYRNVCEDFVSQVGWSLDNLVLLLFGERLERETSDLVFFSRVNLRRGFKFCHFKDRKKVQIKINVIELYGTVPIIHPSQKGS